MRRRLVIALCLLAGSACREPVPPTEGELRLWSLYSSLRTNPELEAGLFLGLCCDGIGRSWFGLDDEHVGPACRELARLLWTEHQPRARKRLLDLGACHGRIPSQAVIGFCSKTRPCSAEMRSRYVARLGQLDSSEQVARELLSQLAWRDPEISDDEWKDIEWQIAISIGALGEDAMRPILAALDSPDEQIRRVVTLGIWSGARDAPYELPGLRDVIERMVRDTELPEELARKERPGSLYFVSRHALDQLRARDGLMPDRAVEQVNDLGIRTLWVRRFSCRAENAAERIKHKLGDDADWALERREQMCRTRPVWSKDR
jgi:hypothetical protein